MVSIIKFIKLEIENWIVRTNFTGPQSNIVLNLNNFLTNSLVLGLKISSDRASVRSETLPQEAPS